MSEKKIMTAVLVNEHQTYTMLEVCEYFNIPEALLNQMEEEGLFQRCEQRMITHEAFKRIESACRIHLDLGVNLSGVALALELLDELDDLRHRLAILERNLK